mmetsp:Transcript_17170/g.32601  ORF Transcript_17170/g.32601 Transcript_17170/m.32601 type:complete len:116 (-) Transcript_17170:65-412(-)
MLCSWSLVLHGVHVDEAIGIVARWLPYAAGGEGGAHYSNFARWRAAAALHLPTYTMRAAKARGAPNRIWQIIARRHGYVQAMATAWHVRRAARAKRSMRAQAHAWGTCHDATDTR